MGQTLGINVAHCACAYSIQTVGEEEYYLGYLKLEIRHYLQIRKVKLMRNTGFVRE